MLHYSKIVSGHQKEWMVLLHGLGGSSTLFYKQKDFLSKYYNLLLIDLPGHGGSKGLEHKTYTPEQIVPEITAVLDKLRISRAHFFAFSVGTIIANELMASEPQYIRTMTLAGPVLKLKKWTSFLIESAFKFRFLAPYMVFYKIFAYIIMPKNSHAKSRFYFVREAAKLGRQEFIKWTFLLKKPHRPIKKLMKKPTSIPILYLIGKEDYLFLDEAKLAAGANPNATLKVLEDCGHVCIIEKSTETNEAVHAFIQQSIGCKKASSM